MAKSQDNMEEATRHAEHGQLVKNVELLEQHYTKQATDLADWMMGQGQKFDDLKEHFAGKMDELLRAMSQKTEMDSAILLQQKDVERRLEDYEDRQAKTSELLTRTATILDGLVVSTNKDLKEAHNSLRTHIEYHTRQLEPRIVALEQKGANMALTVIKYAGTIAGTIFLYWLASKLGVKIL